MPPREEYLHWPLSERVMRLGLTESKLAAAIEGPDTDTLGRRSETLALLTSLTDAQWLRGGHSSSARPG